AAGRSVDARNLPFTVLTFAADERSFDVAIDTARFMCMIAESNCTRVISARTGRGGRGGVLARFGGGLYGDGAAPDNAPRVSPDVKTEASIRNFNVFTRTVGARDWTPLSTDGSDANAYSSQSISWSPDSKKLAAYRVKPGFKREVHYVMSSP